MALSGESVAQVLYQAGFRGQDLINFVAIAGRESGFNPDAHRTDQDPAKLSGDLGLFQINYVNWPAVSQALGLTSKSQLFDPVINAKAAFFLFQQGGYSPWTAGAGGWQEGGDPLYGTNPQQAATYVTNANSMGLLGTSYSGGGGGSVPVSDASTTNNGPITLPSDMTLIRIAETGNMYAIKVLGPGWHISYGVADDGSVQYDPNSVQTVTQAQSDSSFGRGVFAGWAPELATVTQSFGTFGGMWDSIIGQVLGYNNPAKDDPGVLQVIAEFAGRPDMSPQELENKLQATDWFQNHTQGQLEWNSLSVEERRKRTDEMAARMVGAIWQYFGEDVDASDPRIANYIEEVASGKTGFGAWQDIMKTSAADVPESPWARTVRSEGEQKKQRGIDIENTAQNIRETAERWGIQWSAGTINQWAKDIVSKDKSDEDLMTALRNQAQVLYPWKDPEMETMTAAAPWMETYGRVMEKKGGLFTPEIQKALQQGQSAFDFETSLKKSEPWLQTKNGQDSMFSAISEMGARMGFVSG